METYTLTQNCMKGPVCGILTMYLKSENIWVWGNSLIFLFSNLVFLYTRQKYVSHGLLLLIVGIAVLFVATCVDCGSPLLPPVTSSLLSLFFVIQSSLAHAGFYIFKG